MLLLIIAACVWLGHIWETRRNINNGVQVCLAFQEGSLRLQLLEPLRNLFVAAFPGLGIKIELMPTIVLPHPVKRVLQRALLRDFLNVGFLSCVLDAICNMWPK